MLGNELGIASRKAHIATRWTASEEFLTLVERLGYFFFRGFNNALRPPSRLWREKSGSTYTVTEGQDQRLIIRCSSIIQNITQEARQAGIVLYF